MCGVCKCHPHRWLLLSASLRVGEKAAEDWGCFGNQSGRPQGTKLPRMELLERAGGGQWLSQQNCNAMVESAAMAHTPTLGLITSNISVRLANKTRGRHKKKNTAIISKALMDFSFQDIKTEKKKKKKKANLVGTQHPSKSWAPNRTPVTPGLQG